MDAQLLLQVQVTRTHTQANSSVTLSSSHVLFFLSFREPYQHFLTYQETYYERSQQWKHG